MRAAHHHRRRDHLLPAQPAHGTGAHLPDPALRQRLESLEDPREAGLDPALASDFIRTTESVLRGIEVFEQTGQRLSALQEEHARQGPRLKAVRVWLDREDLKERIDRRVLIMMEQGDLQEVRDLLGGV